MFPITTLAAGVPELPGNGGRPSPDQLRYLQRLIGPLLEGRYLAKLYNVLLLVILAALTIRHIVTKTRNRRKQRAIEHRFNNTNEDDNNIQSSSSSSTLEGSASSTASSIHKPPPPQHLDIERQPLLNNTTQTSPSRSPSSSPPSRLTLLHRAYHKLHAWLLYQPPPIPLLNKPLPSNSTTLLILLYLTLNLLILLHHSPTTPDLLFAPADRAGLLFTINLPLLYLLSAKNQPLKPLTGLSYETLNILHRRVGELLCLLALLHFLGMTIWVRITAPHWLQDRFVTFFQTPLVIEGLVAFAAYELLYLTSLSWVRRKWYEFFLASHVVLQILGLGMVWLHQKNARPYVALALVIFVCDRLVWRVFVKSVRLENVDLVVLEDGETVRLSKDWDIVVGPGKAGGGGVVGRLCRWMAVVVVGSDIKSGGWRPADHVFLSIDGLHGLKSKLQAHPFTIASAAPELRSEMSTSARAGGESGGSSRHAWFSLLVRAQGQDGFTSALLRHARLHRSVTVRVDGPYGSHAPLDMLRSRGTSILVAGGSGIAVIFPLAWSLARSNLESGFGSLGMGRESEMVARKRSIHVMWVVHSALHHESWVPPDRLDELREMGVEITMPGPTVVEGRPDVAGYIRDVLQSGEASDGQVGVVVSGPDGLNRSVRNACSRAVGEGRDVAVSVEKFGW